MMSRTLAPCSNSSFLMPGPRNREDTEIAVLDGRSGRDAGDRPGPQVIRVETVIRHQEDRHVFAGLARAACPSIWSWN